MALPKTIGDILAKRWLEENPYCGMSLAEILKRVQSSAPNVTYAQLQTAIDEMHSRDEVSIRQIHGETWVYPQRKILEPRDLLPEEQVGKYTKQLRLGGNILELRFFSRQVLDRYRSDPRYEFEEDAGIGCFMIKDEYFLGQSVPEEDKVILQRFGTGYDVSMNPVVVAILADLGQLSVGHQSYWSSFEVQEKCTVDPEFIKTSFDAEFSERVSPFAAILNEMHEINNICIKRRQPPLFRETYQRNRPEGFGWITKPTTKEYYILVHILDKLMSENLNKDFFRGKVDLTEEMPLGHDRIKVRDKGTIQLLSDFLSKYKLDYKDDILSTFRSIRDQRNAPAHKISSDEYDPEYFRLQRRVVHGTYSALRKLRIALNSKQWIA